MLVVLMGLLRGEVLTAVMLVFGGYLTFEEVG